MSVFDLLAVYCMLFGLLHKKSAWLLAGGAFIFIASFCKGFQGLFPIIVPLLYWLCIQRIRLGQLIKAQCMILIAPVIVYTGFYFWNEAYHFYEQYFQTRLARTFGGNENTTQTRLFLLWKLLAEFLIPVFMAVLIFVFPKKQSFTPQWQWFSFFGLIGLSASLPLMITLEQRPFYLATAMPYFALAISTVFADLIQRRIEKWSAEHVQRAWINHTLKGILVLSVLCLPFFHHMAKRDHAMLHDLKQLKNVFSERQVIQIPLSLEYDWAMHAYFKRYLGVEMDSKSAHSYFVTTRHEGEAPVDTCYTPMEIPLQHYVVYHCDQPTETK